MMREVTREPFLWSSSDSGIFSRLCLLTLVFDLISDIQALGPAVHHKPQPLFNPETVTGYSLIQILSCLQARANSEFAIVMSIANFPCSKNIHGPSQTTHQGRLLSAWRPLKTPCLQSPMEEAIGYDTRHTCSPYSVQHMEWIKSWHELICVPWTHAFPYATTALVPNSRD